MNSKELSQRSGPRTNLGYKSLHNLNDGIKNLSKSVSKPAKTSSVPAAKKAKSRNREPNNTQEHPQGILMNPSCYDGLSEVSRFSQFSRRILQKFNESFI